MIDKRQELKKDYDECTECIDFLKNYKETTKLDGLEAYQCLKQIKEKEAERENIQQQIEKLDIKLKKSQQNSLNNDNCLTSEKLYRILCGLGYQDQSTPFRKLINASPVSSFLIHGSAEYGQRWLLNRLINNIITQSVDSQDVKIYFGCKGTSVSLDSGFWYELGRNFGLRKANPTPSEIANAVYQCWSGNSKNIFLIFYEVHLISSETFNKIIEVFWQPLIEQASKLPIPDNSRKLIMFFIDYKGVTVNWNNSLVENINSSWSPLNPLRAPEIIKFQINELNFWMENHLSDLPFEYREIDNLGKMIIEKSNGGIPERVLDEICYRCEYDWFQESKKWLVF